MQVIELVYLIKEVGRWHVRTRPQISLESYRREGFVRFTFSISLLAVTVALTALGQSAPAKKPAASKGIPRTPDGHPDLQGNWLNHFATPFERPKELEQHTTLTDEEVAEFNRRAQRIFAPDNGSDAADPNAFFLAALRNVKVYKSAGSTDTSERVTDLVIDNRTSVIIDPPDGKMPAYTEAGQARRAAYGRSRSGNGNTTKAEQVAPGDRCITYSVPRLNGVYSAGLHGYYQIVQTKDDIVFFSENIHEVRIISLDGSPHPPASVGSWAGDSIGHWEGDCLVVDTTNFKPQLHPFGISEKFHMTERFTLVSAGEIDYEVTLTDPDTWVKPWTAMLRLTHTDDRLFETACHEGNEAIMKTILTGISSR